MNNQSTMTVRRPRIAFPEQLDPVFFEGQPELSYLLLGMSLLLPYGEPYVIRTMSKAKRRVRDPKLREAITLFNGQEAQHYRLHTLFNKATGVGGPAIADLVAEMARDFEQFISTRSLKWNLAYSVGVEAFTVALARFVLETDVLRDVHPAVRDLMEWHLLEEMEHRAVTHDVYEHLYGGYAYRIAVGSFAQYHYCRFVIRAIAVLLEQDRANGRDLGSEAQARARVRSLSMQMAKGLLPKVLAAYSPFYAPQELKMPASAEAVLLRLAGWNPVEELAASESAQPVVAAD